MIIGITGLIGSGKSTGAKVFKEIDWKVIDADKIGREVVERNPQVLKRLAKHFGANIITNRGNLRRKYLAQKAFSSEATRKKLNQIVHPFLLKELNRKIKKHNQKGDDVVIDAALLLDWHLEKICDYVIMIHSSQQDRLKRLKKRGISRSDALFRQKRQLSYKEYRMKVDCMIRNNSTVYQLKKKLLIIINKINIQ